MEENLHCLRKGTRLIGRYTIEKVLGQGGFGITYLGIDELHEKKVAIKEFFPQGIVTRNIEYEDAVTVTFVGEKDNYNKGKEKFLKEARIMARFSKDEGIVKAQDFFEINNTAYIVMEYLEGITLKQYLRENERIEPEELLELFVPLIESLDEIHSQGLIHRDISPDNIMVLLGGKIKLMDFGAVRDYTDFGEKSLSLILKPGYAPPEQYQTHGVQGPWTDIYALCATMYKCLTGENPPDAIERVMDDNLKEISEFGIPVSKQMGETIIKGMSISARNRYQNIEEFCEDLYALSEETLTLEEEESKVEETLIEEDMKTFSQEAEEEKKYVLHNPKIENDPFVKSGKKVIWDCLWFGKYPQKQITQEDGAIYSVLKNEINWDLNNDVIINGSKYHKTENNYFKYEPIKWRVLHYENSEAFLLADAILDSQPYHSENEEIDWEKSSIRAWLNNEFINKAFSNEENKAINTVELINKDNSKYGTQGGKNTSDKLFLLSLSEVDETEESKEYGFWDKKTRKCKNDNFSEETYFWWLRSPGNSSHDAAGVYYYGWVFGYGYDVQEPAGGIRPALYLNLSSSDLFSYARTISSEGTEDAVPYNTKTKLVQN
ncbi:protein kinase domain-containing protein [Anaerobutyricum hallii]|uniref:protein kinase domain-containing protein n=1 Tax=Anaerobutyricum hallii TaxID=39488 RepID=UPI003521EBFC